MTNTPFAWKIRWWVAYAGLAAIILLLLPSAKKKSVDRDTALVLADYMAVVKQANITVTDDMNIETFSAGAEELLGVDRNSVVGKSMGWIIPDEMRADHIRAWRQWWKTTDTKGKVIHCEAQTYNHKRFPATIWLDPVKGADGKWRVMAQITEEREAITVTPK